MPMPRLAVLPLFAAISFGTLVAFADDLPAVDPAIATMTAEQKVEARQAAMEEDGKLLRGAKDATGDDAVKIAMTVLQNMTNFPALFADGATSAKSKALPVVWTQFDDFVAIFKKGQAAASQMLTAANSGDSTAYADSLKALGGVCFECHQTYRGR